jgi:hypothetical protein
MAEEINYLAAQLTLIQCEDQAELSQSLEQGCRAGTGRNLLHLGSLELYLEYGSGPVLGTRK